jgi:2-(1,2-epoxy-1,2-dihydrophenyl)acetyl-CoA isomerase
LATACPRRKPPNGGLIWAVVDDANLLSEARALAERLAKGPTKAFGEVKLTLDAAAENTLDQQLELERRTQQRLGDTDDFREGVTAFLTKRDPDFKGK